jgi:hypothetical protein
MTKAWQDFSVLAFLIISYFYTIFFCWQLLTNKSIPHAKWMVAATVMLVWLVGIPWTFYKLDAGPELWRVLTAPFA